MSFSEVRTSVAQLLDAERANPTLQYLARAPFVNEAVARASALGQRGWHPRPVSEIPGWFTLQSRNFDLLQLLNNDVAVSDRASLFEMLERRIHEQNPFSIFGSNLLGMGELRRTYSELPLIAEFLVRNDQEKRLIAAIGKAPLRPGLTRLLLHIEEMIAFDYRLFTDAGYDELIHMATTLTQAFARLKKEPQVRDTKESNFRFHVVRDGPTLCDSLLTQAPRAKYLRFSQQAALRATGRLEGIDALRPNDEDQNFQVLAQQVRAAIEAGTPVVGLDRLHTFMVRYIRNLYVKHFGRTPGEASTPNALLGEVANDLRSKGIIKSGMASEILRSTTRVLEKFNHVRNEQTFAHDNDDIIENEEAWFIYQSVAASVRFLQTLGF